MTFDLGVNITLDPKLAARDCAAVAKIAGPGTWVRTSQEPPWGSVTARLGPFRKACDDNGLKLMQCAQTIGHKQPRHQADLDDYAEFVAECAAMADATSGGNEINGFGSNETPDPVAAAATFVAVVETRDRLAPRRQLMTPSMCPAGGPIGSSYVEPLLFFSKMVEAERSILAAKKLWLDWHGYCDGRYNPNYVATWNTVHRTRDLHAYVAGLGFPDLHVSWSEMGTQTGPPGWAQRVDEATQALRFNQQLLEARAQRKAGGKFAPLVWYTIRDSQPNGPTDWPACAGLLRLDGSERPVAAAFRTAA